MKRLGLSVFCIAFTLALSGCVPIPIPHVGRVTPTFKGSVIDAQTSAPLNTVKVSLKDLRSEEVLASTTTDEHGSYLLHKKKLKLFFFFWLGPAEGIKGGVLVFEKAGYSSETMKQTRFCGAESYPTFTVSIPMKKTEANQTPVPTATSVTPAADAPVAPAAAAAQL